MRQSVPHRLAVVVLNWRDLARTLRCVSHLDQCPQVETIVLVDNESDGRLEQEIERRGLARTVTIAGPRNLGYSSGVNLGIRHVLEDHTHVLLVNNDAVIEPDSIALLLDASVAAGDRCVVTPTVLRPDGSVESSGEVFRRLTFSVRPARIIEQANFLTFACVLVPTAVFASVGLLDERFFMYWEDVDFGLRCRAAGLSFAHARDATVYHERSASHSRAGGRIDVYSAFGVTRLAMGLGGLARVGGALRICLRFARRLARGEVRAAQAVMVGAYLGVSSRDLGADTMQRHFSW